ncbi:MAG: hypothetical protein WKG07_00295 [Hymenobacter sp.]
MRDSTCFLSWDVDVYAQQGAARKPHQRDTAACCRPGVNHRHRGHEPVAVSGARATRWKVIRARPSPCATRAICWPGRCFRRCRASPTWWCAAARPRSSWCIPDAAQLAPPAPSPRPCCRPRSPTPTSCWPAGNLASFRRLYLTLTDTRLGTVEDLRQVRWLRDRFGTGWCGCATWPQWRSRNSSRSFVIINANGHDAVLIDLVKQQGVRPDRLRRRLPDAKAAELRRLLPPA